MITTNVKELWETIEWLNTKVESLTKETIDHSKLKMDVVNLIKEGRFIAAVKYYREKTHVSLKEAKDYCDIYRDEVVDGKWGEYNLDHYKHYLLYRNR